MAAIADDGIPQMVGFGLVAGLNLKTEGLVMLEMRAAVQPNAKNADDGKLDCEGIACLPSE